MRGVEDGGTRQDWDGRYGRVPQVNTVSTLGTMYLT
jgi:hypothetical protein